MQLRDAREHAEVLQQLAIFGVFHGGLEVLPVDVDRSVGHGSRQFEESGALRAHGSDGSQHDRTGSLSETLNGGESNPGDTGLLGSDLTLRPDGSIF